MKNLKLLLMTGAFAVILSVPVFAQGINQEASKLSIPEPNNQRLLAINVVVTSGGNGYHGGGGYYHGHNRYWVRGHYSYRHGYRHWIRGHYVYRY